jgi:Inverse autotransporter, beta-domain
MMARGVLRAARFGLCVTLLMAGYPALAGDAPPPPGKWEPWAEIAGYAANRSYAQRGETALWMPFMQDGRSLLFADIRGKLFEDDEHEGNLALGYRFMGANGWNPGIWFGLDRRTSLYGNDFDQFSFGAELLSKDWDVRLNGYVPLEDTKPVPGGGTVQVVGNSIFLVSGGFEELALWGFDAEVGYRVPLERYGLDGRVVGPTGPIPGGRYNDLRLFAGAFYFDNSGFDGEVLGLRLRVEWRVENVIEAWEGSRLTFDASYQYDDVRNEQVEAGLRLRIPLGGETPATPRYALSAQEKRMTEGLKRDTDIVARKRPRPGGGGVQEPVEDAATGVDFDTVVIVANGSDLQAAMTGAGSNALVVAQGGATDFNGVAMLAQQTLLGGGGTIDIRGRTSGTVASYTAPGTRPTILGCCFAILADNDAHIASVTLDGQNVGFAGVEAIGASTVIDNVEIRDFDVGLLYITPASHVVRNTTISGSDLAAIYVTGGSLDVRGSTIRDGGTGILLDGSFGGSTLAVNNTTFDGVFTGHLLEFDFAAHTVTASTGIVDNATSAGRCIRFGGASFTGTLGFTGGDIVDATCN